MSDFYEKVGWFFGVCSLIIIGLVLYMRNICEYSEIELEEVFDKSKES